MDAQSWVAMMRVLPWEGRACISSKISSVVSGSKLPGKGTMPPHRNTLDMPSIRGLAVYIDKFTD